ncbi:reverse transcriptase domain-containing protein [Tanacetum coccineum]
MESGILFNKRLLGSNAKMCRSITSKLCHPEDPHRVLRYACRSTSRGKKGDKARWGMDILGPLPPARGGAKFVIVAIDYFTKWIEAKPLVKITGKKMNTVVAHPQANGLVERSNRSLMEEIKTRLGREKARWVDKFPNVLWAHWTSIKQINRETPLSLTYGSEAVIPAEIGIPTYRTLTIREGYNEEEMRLNLDQVSQK